MRAIYGAALLSCSSLVMVGCSSGPDTSNLFGAGGGTESEGVYPLAFDEFLNSVQPGAVGLVDLYSSGVKVRDYRILAFNYSQEASQEQMEILIRELAKQADVKRFVDDGCKIAPLLSFHVSVDGKPLLVGEQFSVNEDYCTTGELKWLFVSGEAVSNIGWIAEAPRSIHLFHDGRFSQEVMPGFTGGISWKSGQGVRVRDFGLFVVKGRHDVTIPVGWRSVLVEAPGAGVWTAGWFDNEKYN